ncbi:MAG: hypothetical protein GXP46_05630 [Deferribacteres bacterium]|nr:hypothetical protein [Deferribacteres bacterium]
MPDYVKPYIDKIEGFAKSRNELIELLLIGGLAMSFYGLPRYTIDIDAEIKCSDKIYFELIEYLKKENVSFNISDNISGWGIIPLPAGYRDRAQTVYKGDYLILKVLEPVDFVFSKLLRGTEEDFGDASEVINKYGITRDLLLEREKLIHFPKDPETLFFKKKFRHLLELTG